MSNTIANNDDLSGVLTVANTAQTTANTAQTTANSAQTTANTANSSSNSFLHGGTLSGGSISLTGGTTVFGNSVTYNANTSGVSIAGGNWNCSAQFTGTISPNPSFTIGGGTFSGSNLSVSGTLSKGGGSFFIDHPLAPTEKYLYHSFVESPDMLNIYNGTILADASGNATVTLPDWFEALNQSFQYQLTCIGSYAPVYVSSEISQNSFTISGATPGLKISWQVTGVRQDPFANANRIIVEVDKAPEDQGLYLHPEAYGQPPEMGIKP